MNSWYILPNGNIKHLDGLEVQPECDWLPTDQSLETYAERQRETGKTELQIMRMVMQLAMDGEAWVKENLG
jgi:hypothetical protein